MYSNEDMVGRYYEIEEFGIDINRGLSNYTQELLNHALEFIDRKDSSPYFLYRAPDSTHAPTYSSDRFVGRSVRSSYYGDAVMELDWALGQIIGLVRSKQKGGSNGPLLCGKQTTFEGGMKTPTIAWWGKRRVNGVSHHLGSHMDFLPTFAELAEASLPPSLVS